MVALRNWWGEHLVSRAVEEQRGGNINGASKLYEKALRLGKDDAAVALAKMAYYRRDWEEVRHYASRAISINPLRGYVHILLAYTRASEREVSGTGDVEYVMDECRRAVALDPTNAGLWRACADLSLRLYLEGVRKWGSEETWKKYRDETVQAYRMAMRHDPGEARSVVYYLIDSHPGPGFLLEATMGKDEALLREMVQGLLDKGHWEETREAYWKEAARSSSAKDYYRAAAEALRRAGRYGEAFETLKGYLLLDPDDAVVSFRAAEVGASRGSKSGLWKEAGNMYLNSVRLEPANSNYRRRYGIYLFRDERLPEARAQLDRAVGRDPTDDQAYFYIGRVVERQKGREEALEYYRKALALNPTNANYRNVVEKGE